MAAARILGNPAAEELAREAHSGASLSDALLWQARALAFQARANGERLQSWAAVMQVLGTERGALRLDESCLLRQAYMRLDRRPEASSLEARLQAADYANPVCFAPGDGFASLANTQASSKTR